MQYPLKTGYCPLHLCYKKQLEKVKNPKMLPELSSLLLGWLDESNRTNFQPKAIKKILCYTDGQHKQLEVNSACN